MPASVAPWTQVVQQPRLCLGKGHKKAATMQDGAIQMTMQLDSCLVD